MKTCLHLCLALLISPGVSHALDAPILKLHGRWALSPADYRLGYPDFSTQTVACTEKWIIAGASRASEGALHQGAAQVFNAVTGAWVRKLLPPGTPVISQQFGASCAIIGDKALIGAPGDSNTSGKVFVFNLTNGSLLMTLTPNAADVTVNALFGSSLAVSGNKVIVGASGDQSYRGSAFVFDLKTGAKLAKLQAADGAAGHTFASCIAAEGNVAVIGCPGVDGFKGAVYAFDLTTFAMIRKIQPTSLVAGDVAGYSVTMHQGRVVFGASGSAYFSTVGTGQVFIVDLFSGSEGMLLSPSFHEGERFGFSVAAHQGLLLVGTDDAIVGGNVHVFGLDGAYVQTLSPPDHDDPALALRFGHALAICGSTAVVVEPHESTQAPLAGALYLFRNLQRPMTLQKVTRKGDFAPGGVEINFATIGESFINADGEMAFTSTLSGLGSNSGKDSGAWSTLGANQGLDLVLKSRQADGGVGIGIVSKPLINRPETGIFQATLTGDGVTPLNNQAIYADKGTVATRLFRTGTALPAFNNAMLSSFGQVVQNRAGNRIISACMLRTGTASTTNANDSAILWHDIDGSITDIAREGAPAGNTPATYGQFSGRIAGCFDHAIYTTAVAGPLASNQALFQKPFGLTEFVVDQKGDPASGAGGALFSSFLGESSDADGTVLYRATITGPVATNEALFTRTLGITKRLVMRKGDALPGLPAVKIAKFINYWQVAGQTLALVQVAGKGVTAATDQALLLYQTTAPFAGETVILMREGDPAPGCDPATIGVISRVQVEQRFGAYVVLATLLGAPAGTDQVLFRGNSALGTLAGEQTLRRPVPVLRKGQMFTNQPSKLKSISLPVTNLTASGACGVGLGSMIREATTVSQTPEIVIAVDYDNGEHVVMRGAP